MSDLPAREKRSPTVLIVEDEPKTAAAVAEALRFEGWQVAIAASLSAAREHLAAAVVDLLVLDRTLPDGDGLDLLAVPARGRSFAVLVLTAHGGLEERVAGLERGADDYLAKPFALVELVARCRALWRRQQGVAPVVLECEDLRLDTRLRTARRADREIALTPREVDLLQYFLRHQGKVVSREMLERDVWRQTHRLTSLDNVIDVQVMRLRKKIDHECAERLLHTVRGVGYRLGGANA